MASPRTAPQARTGVHISAILAAIALTLLACGSGDGATPPDDDVPVDTAALRAEAMGYVPAATWRTATAARMGLDPEGIASIGQRVRSGAFGSDIHSYVVIRFGHVVLEAHAPGTDGARAHTMQSVTKSVGSLLAGIAAAESALQVDHPVLDFYADVAGIANVDTNKRALTVRHLLQMRTGMSFWENPYPGSPLQQLNDSRDDWARLVLDRPMTGAPGATWSYNSGGVILLGAILQRATGTALATYARTRLFAEIGVTGETWARAPYDGLPHLGGGLSLSPLDAARVGYLVLRRGRWGAKQVVSESWIDESTRPVTRNVAGYGGRPTDYGLLWWSQALGTFTTDAWDERVIMGVGAMGQWLFIVPRYDLVVVATGGASGGGAFRGIELFLGDVLGAVR